MKAARLSLDSFSGTSEPSTSGSSGIHVCQPRPNSQGCLYHHAPPHGAPQLERKPDVFPPRGLQEAPDWRAATRWGLSAGSGAAGRTASASQSLWAGSAGACPQARGHRKVRGSALKGEKEDSGPWRALLPPLSGDFMDRRHPSCLHRAT